ncbi:MAG: MSMEG_4193 family putative phosphomutase [Anaerolineae bacterium]|nr:MSMEG_4193 family putative phosphomutase [Anaerolineae bacterium]
MSEFLLIRHAVNDFVKTGRLAGWTPGVHLNEDGRAQAEALGHRLAKTRIDALYSSPLERTVETAEAVLAHHPHLKLNLLDDVGEVRYGTWQGAEIKSLVKRKMWRVVQINPSRARFPGGESMREAQMRAVNAIEMLNERHPRSAIAVVSHSDIIKMIVAHYLGVHLDLFQRIDVSPASLTILRLGYGRPVLVQLNEASYLPPPRQPKADERSITAIRPATALTLDAVGEPGARMFFLQAAGPDVAPVTFALEKTQALLLAGQIEAFLAEMGSPTDGEVPPAPPLAAPEPLMFRAGGFTLKYEGADGLVGLVVSEMLGEGQGAPRTVALWATPGQLHSLAAQARAVAARGRQQQA